MKRATVQLKDLNDNPFFREVNNGFIDQGIIDQLVESIHKHGLWVQWVVRKTSKGEYELAFGHHRREAAIKVFGKNHEVSVQVEDYDDDLMFTAAADENAGPEQPHSARCDIVRIARERLQADPKRCKIVSAAGRPKPQEGRPHEHGSAACVSAYLGEQTWSLSTVKELLQLEDALEKSILQNDVAAPGSTNGHGVPENKIRHKDALAISQLEKPAQREAAKVLKSASSDGLSIPTRDVKQAVEEAKTTAIRKVKTEQRSAVIGALQTASSKDKALVATKTVDRVLERINAAPTSQKKQEAVVSELRVSPAVAKQVVKAAQKPVEEVQPKLVREALEKRVEEARIVKLEDGNAVAQRIAQNLHDFPDDEVMQNLIAARELLYPYVRKGLIIALQKTKDRLTQYAEQLSRPAAKPPSLTLEGEVFNNGVVRNPDLPAGGQP